MGRWPSVVQTEIAPGAPVVCKVLKLDLNIDETNAAGVYTAAFDIPAGAIVLGVGMHAVAVWNAGTSALMDVGDADVDSIFNAVNMAATDLTAGQGDTLWAAGGDEGADIAGTLTHWNGAYLATKRTINFTLTTVGTAPTTGETICYVYYALPDNAGDGITINSGTYVAT